MKLRKLSQLFLTLALSGLISTALATPAYSRFPAIRGDNVVFTSEGDLWKVAATGGQAQRLTSHPAAEINPAISHDGKWIAFSASYEGALEAYVMPAAGGIPKRLSFENSAVNVLGWTATGQVLVSMQRSSGPSGHRIVASINPQNMLSQVFAVADANEAVLDDSGRYLYFTRYGLHMTNDNARKYRGGTFAQLWRYELQGKSEATPVFTGTGSINNKRPMWWNNRLYFLNDEDGAYNLYSTNPDGSERRQLTHHKDWEVRNPSLGDGKIVYQLGADLHVFDLATQNDKTLEISLLSDFDQQRQRQIKSPLEHLTHVELAGKQQRLLFTARGHLAIAGNNSQRRIEIAIPEGSRAREAVFSHDDKSVYALLDASGENEIWQFAADGTGKGHALTSDGTVHRWNIYPSPDGKWLAHTDKRGRLYLLDLLSKANILIDDGGKFGIEKHEEVSWSADSKTIAIARPIRHLDRRQIGLYSIDSKQLTFTTSDRYDSFSPAFSADGHWLYFISNRNFQASNPAPWGDRNMGPYFDKRGGVYALALQAGQRFPFKPEDELSKASKPETPDEKKPEDKKSGDETKKSAPAINYTGLSQRLYQVPLAAGNYQDLAVDDKRLYFMEREANEERKFNLKTLAISAAAPQPELFIGGIQSYQLSSAKKHLSYRTASTTGTGEFVIVEAGAKQPADISKAKVKMDDWSFRSTPRLEWQQIFLDAWRMHRDFLFDDKMRGVNWEQMRSKYAPLVERVSDRAELNDVLAQMISEVGTLHSQLRVGDIRKAEPDGKNASLGAVLTRTTEGYRIEHIYRSEAELPSQTSPLAQPDLDIQDGDLITAINGRPVLEARDISDLLINQVEQQVLLQVKRGKATANNFIVTPVSMEKHASLRYSDWEQGRSSRVHSASQGQIGYLHLRAMGKNDIANFAREFYANINRDGLIIDVRRNNGGNIDSFIIEKLLRKAWAFWTSPKGVIGTNMQQTFRGHLVVLIDELTYSDGETFAAGIKELKLAPLVGKRTAGAGVWLDDQNTLADNGMARVAENGQFAVSDGRWLVEGTGVTPDVEVENLPNATFKGEDRQLEVALSMLQKKISEQAIKTLVPQAIPALK
ncbi:S41 family peptidase [Undibacterium sp.]|uniref:S41 family peptidase n=1 Tax=Undibacterium sp. TaxID=1914977 RepID=UPI0025FB9BD3|nr:S41 family peptidase [Undibacterium sp.]